MNVHAKALIYMSNDLHDPMDADAPIDEERMLTGSNDNNSYM